MCTGGRDTSGTTPGRQNQPVFEEESEGDTTGEMVLGEFNVADAIIVTPSQSYESSGTLV